MRKLLVIIPMISKNSDATNGNGTLLYSAQESPFTTEPSVLYNIILMTSTQDNISYEWSSSASSGFMASNYFMLLTITVPLIIQEIKFNLKLSIYLIMVNFVIIEMVLYQFQWLLL